MPSSPRRKDGFISFTAPATYIYTHAPSAHNHHNTTEELTEQRAHDVEVALEELEPEPAADGRVRIGYLDAHHGRPLRLTLKDSATAEAALPGRPAAYRRLDTAVPEALR